MFESTLLWIGNAGLAKHEKRRQYQHVHVK